MDCQRPSNAWKWQVLYCFCLCSWGWVSGQLHYSILEESETGTLVGNIAHDLGIALTKSNKQRLRLGSGGGSKFFAVDQLSGDLTVNGRIDRESLCGSNLNCLLYLEIATENPLGFYSIEIEIVDINDNAPIFSNPGQIINITELATSPGVRFPLQMAQDPDVGTNSVSQYRLSPNPHFSLSVTNRKDGTLIAVLILEKVLDREEKGQHSLILTAFDDGEPKRSGSIQVTIIVLDINDNPPVFDQQQYKINLLENIPLTSVIIKLNATDLDDGPNAEIIYFFDDHTLDSAKKIFELNSNTGEIYIAGILDFEESHYYELSVRARDRGILTMEGQTLIQIEVEDINDNIPEIFFTSNVNEIPENAAIGTVVGYITVRDKDSGKNGEIIVLDVSPNVPFKCQSFNNRYSLVTSGNLDREKVSQYNIILTASDLGSPPLHNHTTITLIISDVNDNAPMFSQSVYQAFIKENNEAGSLLCTVSASDPDIGDNAKLKYSIAESHIDGSSTSSFIYINGENGNIYAQRSFDYEQVQVLQITTRVEDSGSPALFSNVSVFIFILDTNDNHPTVLYPENAGEFIPQEKIPMSASAGYLVTKVSAVDLDSGHNAWLAYSLLESSSPTLFQISEYTGEIRTIRGLHETDNAEQRLVISVRDHGQPALSTTVTIHVRTVESVQDIPKSSDFLSHSKPSSDLTLYLIISLVAISLVSLVTFIILLVRCLRKDTDSISCGSCPLSKSHSQTYSDQYKPTLYLNSDGTLKYMEVRMVPAETQGQSYPTYFPTATEQNHFIPTKPLLFPNLTDLTQEAGHTSDSSGLNESNELLSLKDIFVLYLSFWKNISKI
uniref:Cadherin domain-containing protein n=1 Tax=Leptobrachium leishanense TaxID=445787 RepID=A0A8C5W987_9ANUR